MTKTSKEKRCSKCHKIYPRTPEYFYRHRRSKDGLNCYCKKCNLECCRKYSESKKGKTSRRKYSKSKKGKQTQKRYAATVNGRRNRRNNSLKSKYNFTLKEYNKLFQQQNGKCAICGNSETASNRYGIRVLAVDHNHKTGKVRGLLCDRCNRMIGFAKENKNILGDAIKYLGDGERYSKDNYR